MHEPDPPPIPETEFQVAGLVVWARSQPSFLVHPGIVAKGTRLAVSMPVSAGTPLIGVKSEGYIREMLDLPTADGGPSSADAECHRLTQAADKPSMWPLRLALRLLKEANDPESCWQAYIQSLAPRPQVPLMWSVTQANELQYLPAKRALKDQLLELRSFHDAHLASNSTFPLRADILPFVSLVASAGARGIEVEPGRRALLPLVDLVCPPEGGVATAEVPSPPSCSLEMEEDVTVVTAARDLLAGEVLTRDHALTHDELLLRHGLAGASGSLKDDVVLWAGVSSNEAKPWQLRELRQELTTEPGVSPGSLIVRSTVRRHRKLSEALGRDLIYASRVLACEREIDLHGVGEWARDESKVSKGLAGLGTEQRRSCILSLVSAIEGYQKTFDTTAEQDAKLLCSVRNNWKVAVAYRLEKKRVMEDVLELLERAKDREVQKRARRREEVHLPAAVTGRKPTPESRSFQKADAAGPVASKGRAADKATDPRIVKGARVEIIKGILSGTVGVVDTKPNRLGTVTIKIDTGKRVDYVSLKNLKLLEPAPEEDSESAGAGSSTAEEAEKSAPEPLEFSSGASKDTERVAEAVSTSDLDLELDAVLEAAASEPPRGKATGSPAEVVDVEALAAAAAEPAAPVPEPAAELAPEPAAEAAPEPVAPAVEPVEPAAEPTEPVVAAEEVGREPTAGAGAADPAGGLAELEMQVQELQASLQSLERLKIATAMRAAGVEEEKVQKVLEALAEPPDS